MNSLKEKESTVLEGLESCDKCIAKATCIITKSNLLLFFCNHHKNEYLPELSRTGWSINIL